MQRLDADTLLAVFLLVPAAFAVLVYLFPDAVLLIGGLLMVYAGGAVGALFGLEGFSAAVGTVSGGVSLMALGGALAAVLRGAAIPP